MCQLRSIELVAQAVTHWTRILSHSPLPLAGALFGEREQYFASACSYWRKKHAENTGLEGGLQIGPLLNCSDRKAWQAWHPDSLEMMGLIDVCISNDRLFGPSSSAARSLTTRASTRKREILVPAIVLGLGRSLKVFRSNCFGRLGEVNRIG